MGYIYIYIYIYIYPIYIYIYIHTHTHTFFFFKIEEKIGSNLKAEGSNRMGIKFAVGGCGLRSCGFKMGTSDELL